MGVSGILSIMHPEAGQATAIDRVENRLSPLGAEEMRDGPGCPFRGRACGGCAGIRGGLGAQISH
jgi:hypothetical protein